MRRSPDPGLEDSAGATVRPALRPMDHSRDQECKVQVIGSVCSQDATADCVDICGSENEQECKTSPRHGPLPQPAISCHGALRKDGEFVALRAMAKGTRVIS